MQMNVLMWVLVKGLRCLIKSQASGGFKTKLNWPEDYRYHHGGFSKHPRQCPGGR